MAIIQLRLFLIYIATGIAISLIFDIFRSIRKTIRTGTKLTTIEDILFWIIIGTILIMEILYFNSGELRLYILLGLILGSSIYLLVASKFVIKINTTILTVIKKIIIKLIKLIIIPIRFLQKIWNKIIFRKNKVAK